MKSTFPVLLKLYASACIGLHCPSAYILVTWLIFNLISQENNAIFLKKSFFSIVERSQLIDLYQRPIANRQKMFLYFINRMESRIWRKLMTSLTLLNWSAHEVVTFGQFCYMWWRQQKFIDASSTFPVYNIWCDD